MLAFNMNSPADVLADVASRAKRRRIEADLTQRDLASRSGVSYASIRVFEETGKISFEALVKIAFILEADTEFASLFLPRPKQTISKIVENPKRQRVRKK